jgi:hypothetical protein
MWPLSTRVNNQRNDDPSLSARGRTRMMERLPNPVVSDPARSVLSRW